MKMVLGVLVVVILVILAVGMCAQLNAQTAYGSSSATASGSASSSSSSAKAKTVTCVKDSFDNLTCTNGDRIIRDSNGNVTVIPGRK